MKYNWSKENIESVIKECDSLTQVLDKLNIPRAGNNSATLRKKLEEYNMELNKKEGLRIIFQQRSIQAQISL